MKFKLLIATIGLFLSSVEGLKSHNDYDDYQDNDDYREDDDYGGRNFRQYHKDQNNQNKDQAPCADNDDQCWLDFLGIDCQITDYQCVKDGLKQIFGQLPDCADGDKACWDQWANGLQNSAPSNHLRNVRSNMHKKYESQARSHAKKIAVNHLKLSIAAGKHKHRIKK